MTDILLILGYAVMFLITYRKAYLFIDADTVMGGNSDPTDRAFQVFFAAIAALFWPVVLVCYTMYRFFTPVTPRQREAELKERERRIEAAERELGWRK